MSKKKQVKERTGMKSKIEIKYGNIEKKHLKLVTL